MPELSYSDDAINIKNSFYKVNAIAYVEGDDDLMFWDEIFSRVPKFKVEIEQLGSCSALDEMIEKIESGSINAIAARDSDYLKAQGKLSLSPRVLYTHGYSIENSLISEASVIYALRSLCRDPKISVDVVKEWMAELQSNLRELTILDLAASISKTYVSVLGDNSSRFTTSSSSHVICVKKCAQVATVAASKIPEHELSKAVSIINNFTVIEIIRGHFLLSNLQKFIVKIGAKLNKKISLSYDSLYSVLLLFFARKLDDKSSREADYVNSAKLAVEDML
ncbi:DUF4435 domain-containing protein [Xanthomonas sp. CFBP 7698]|uniref:DUF4435 domain-containing protein n=1 Tax=Xanthomonas sp. CFBP 7698 TaxID=2082399 RepID=UPI000EEC3406|nr:DUF4435 domain-containing protein [Xanthomonas sp. CFBP 7698]RJS02521.1 hypothetical protein XnspCFBP7698_16460 [Xanthomonas sp. CFBP 7698]